MVGRRRSAWVARKRPKFDSYAFSSCATGRGQACSSCGATADVECCCGVPYMPAGRRAAEAVAANPEKSNRVIAEEIGVDERTVRSARKSTAEYSAVEKRIGKDGNARRLPTKSDDDLDDRERYEARTPDTGLPQARSRTLLRVDATKGGTVSLRFA